MSGLHTFRFANAAEPLAGSASHALTILHTNDLHGHLTPWTGFSGDLAGKTVGGVASLATAIKRIRSQTNAVLLLDAGDLIGDTMIADLTKGDAVIRAYNALGYDALAFGNHEPDFGVSVLRERMAQAHFPFLAANLRDKASGKLFAQPSLIKRVGSVTVGVLGVTYPKTAWTTTAKNVAELSFEPPEDAVREELPKLREAGAELVVVLSHLGLTGDKALAKAVSGIDIIVGGHSHNRMTKPERIGNTLIVQAGAHGSDLGRLDVIVEGGRMSAHEYSLLVLDHNQFPPDGEMAKLVQTVSSAYVGELDEVIGSAEGLLIRAQTLAGQEAERRDQESAIDSLFADIVRSESKADIGFLPGVGYGVAIPPGPVTAAQLRQLVPHEGKVVTMTLKGDQVRGILEQAVNNVHTEDVREKVGGMIQVSGLCFTYDSRKQRGERISTVNVGNAELQNEREYWVATNSMLAGGGHNQQTFLAGKNKQELGSQYEVIRGWFKRHSPVRPPELGRIAHTK